MYLFRRLQREWTISILSAVSNNIFVDLRDLFFHYLLPPIILDSAIALYNEAFIDNFISILTFAILGTLFNIFCIGYSLFGLSQAGVLGAFETFNSTLNATVTENISATECLIFSSLISAGNEPGLGKKSRFSRE